MSDDQFYREAAIKRFKGMLARLKVELEAAGLPPDIAADAVARLSERTEAILEDQFKAGLWSKVEWQRFLDFAFGLLHRQGSTDIDFDEIYRRKAELDAKFL